MCSLILDKYIKEKRIHSYKLNKQEFMNGRLIVDMIVNTNDEDFTTVII